MWREAAIALVLAAHGAGCASTGGGISFGTDVNDHVKKTLRSEPVEALTMLSSGRAYWIGPNALATERKAFLEALAATSVAEPGKHGIPPIGHARNDELTLNDVGSDDVVGFYHPSDVLDVACKAGFLRVLRMPYPTWTAFEVWTQDPDWKKGAYVMVVRESPALRSAWQTLTSGVKRSAGKIYFGSPYAGPLRGAPLRTRDEIMRDVGVDIRGLDE
ncbi:MAG: hypothetical protein ACYSX0_21295 [Planctomycetota bacterium]